MEWTKPGAFEVADHVYRIPLPLPHDGLRAVNVYALLSSDEVVLIDAGWDLDQARTDLDAALTSIGCSVVDVSRMLVTHHHADHYTQAVALRRDSRGQICLGIGERDSLERIREPGARSLDHQLQALREHGAESVAEDIVQEGLNPHPDPSQWEMPNVWLRGTEQVSAGGRVLDVVATPGHTRGHVVFCDHRDGLMFSGDHLLPHITPSIGFESVPPPLPLGNYLASLTRVREDLPDLRLLPAHGPVEGGSHDRAEALLAHHDHRLAEAAKFVAAGGETAFDVARRLRWTRRERTFDTLDALNGMLAVLETAAHLDVLAARGLLVRQVEGGLVRYLNQDRRAG